MGGTKACVHEFVEFARTIGPELGILLGCTHCPATKTDWPARKTKRK